MKPEALIGRFYVQCNFVKSHADLGGLTKNMSTQSFKKETGQAQNQPQALFRRGNPLDSLFDNPEHNLFLQPPAPRSGSNNASSPHRADAEWRL